MPTESLGRDVLDDVRLACEESGRPTTRGEVERALEPLSHDERDKVRRLARALGKARPLGPDALVDVAFGTPMDVAAARELGGYYALKAERDALARLAGARTEPEPPVPVEPTPPTPLAPPTSLAPTAPPTTTKRARAASAEPATAAKPGETEALMTLFAYHRDAVRVAQELGVGLSELNERVEALGLKRRIHRLLETTTDIDVFSPERLRGPKSAGAPAPVVRKRGEKPALEPVVESEPEVDETDAPAARTEPINAHGTRVYRREERKAEPLPPSGTATGRREYVREARRTPKLAIRPKEPRVAKEPAAPPRQPFTDLQSSAGKVVLERLLADEKANPRVFVAKLAERYDGPGRELSESDLRQLLLHHGLAETFQEREIQNTRFLIGFHQGAKGKLQNALALDAAGVAAYLQRLGLDGELERLRAERARIELGRKRLGDRLVQVLTRAPYLDDLGVLGVIDREVKSELERLFAERAGRGTPQEIAEAVRAQLGLEPNPFAKLLRRYEMSRLAGAE